MSIEQTKTLLSVLSHVAHGYVGNRAAVFPLQYFGWDVDAVHTTNFLNHPGYGKFQGQKSDAELVKSLFQGLREVLDFDTHYNVVLVGYCPSGAVMRCIYDELEPTLRKDTKPILVVDPVLGDNGRLYVPEEVVAVHKEFLKLGFVDLTTPNQFEVELLTGCKISSFATAKAALETFYDMYKVPNVVILSALVDGQMYAIGFSAANVPGKQVFTLPINKIDCAFSGCGDVFTALLTNEFYNNSCSLTPEVVGSVLDKLRQILLISYEDEKRKLGQVPLIVHDVRLIQLRHVLEQNFTGELAVEYW